MARSLTISNQAHRWVGALSRQRAGLRLYQWLWIVLCVLGALAITMPRVVSQPIIYQTLAKTRFDVALYGGIYAEVAPGLTGFDVAAHDATEALRQRFLAQRELRFGSPTFRIEYVSPEPGVVEVCGIAQTAAEAQLLANLGAEELTRQIRAAGGREVLRNLLGWELMAALDGEAPTSRFQSYLRTIIAQEAFPLSRRIQPLSERFQVDHLPAEEQNDLTRALESRYDLWTVEINTRNARLDAWCGTDTSVTTAVREAALRDCAALDSLVEQELTSRNQAIEKRQAIGQALRYMHQVPGMTFTPDAPGTVQRITAELPLQPVPRQIGLSLMLATLAGLTAGGISVAVDRSAGVMPRLQDLWAYRELIRNLVLRDLRVRYKGSALGYLWTQLAPLLLMLVFWFVFSTLFQSPIAMFAVFLIAGLLPWNYCSEAVIGGTRSVIDNANLIKKVFFPREVLPLVCVFSSMVNYLLSLPMMFLVMIVVQMVYAPLGGRLNFSWTIAYLPVLLFIQTLFLAGVALFLSTVAVFFRDTVHLIGILMQFWFFLTPVFYSLDFVNLSDPVVRLIRWLNPMASLIEFYREILYGNPVGVGQIPTPSLPALDSVARVLVTSLLVLALGYWFFHRHSGQFGEEL